MLPFSILDINMQLERVWFFFIVPTLHIKISKHNIMSSNWSTSSSGGKEENVVGDDIFSCGTRKEAGPKTDLFKCPSTITKDYAKGPFNRKKPFLQFVTARPQDKKNVGRNRVWDCHDDFRGSYARLKSLFRCCMPWSQSLSWLDWWVEIRVQKIALRDWNRGQNSTVTSSFIHSQAYAICHWY